MKARIVKIGNSRGIRIPKPLIQETGLTGEVELVVGENRLVISPVQRPRSGWSEAFKAMAAAGDDALLDAEAVRPNRPHDHQGASVSHTGHLKIQGKGRPGCAGSDPDRGQGTASPKTWPARSEDL
jgi:antitoxin MazE